MLPTAALRQGGTGRIYRSPLCGDRIGHVDQYPRRACAVAHVGERFWSPSSFAASCGGAPVSVIKEYIDNQKRPD